MSRHIAEKTSTRINWSAFTTIGGMTPPRDPDEEDEDKDEEDDDDEDSTDEPAVVREPDDE